MEKMWPSFERQQAVERLIREKGKAYVLPVRLDGFRGEVPGLSGSIGYLSANSKETDKVVDAFLRKIGRAGTVGANDEPTKEKTRPLIPKLKRKFTDKEKNQFLKSSFEEVVNLMELFAAETEKEHPHFEYEKEMITSRKAIFTLYENEEQVTQFKLLSGGVFGENSIMFSQGRNIDIENDSSANEIISLEEYEGELKLKPTGRAIYGSDKDRLMSPRDVAEYLWEIVFR